MILLNSINNIEVKKTSKEIFVKFLEKTKFSNHHRLFRKYFPYSVNNCDRKFLNQVNHNKNFLNLEKQKCTQVFFDQRLRQWIKHRVFDYTNR